MRAGSATLLAVTAGRRATTLRARTYALKKFLGWLKADRDMTFPHDLACFVDYLSLLADSSCTRSTVTGMKAAMAFLELTAGIAPHLQRTKSPIFTNLYSEVLATKRARVLPRPAPRPLLTLLASLEEFVSDHDQPLCLRMHAWQSFRAVLRHADHRGFVPLDPTLCRFTEGTLRATLVRSKSIGADKLVKTRPAHITPNAFVKNVRWLETGWQLLVDTAPMLRDYLLLSPADKDHSLRGRELSHADATGLSLRLFYKLRCPSGSSRELLLHQGLHKSTSVNTANAHSCPLRSRHTVGIPRKTSTSLVVGKQHPEWHTYGQYGTVSPVCSDRFVR